ncbi:class I SAM-dependent methyltransferase [Pseudoflavonifractor sp. 60]|uniref:class I SAM-dependent DNA methyltransferase n=1 Tax=Pseudoflavonifractor sp. 60 TaxID=2304576 RepID=UPI00136976CC|nr:class I SAM-dependent methyltransferase [Pseudoflavonifractor sp. 60]NBI68567.1 class I SAM-dependent methyltransferase [Pseudoflavonifractor sp. 60]
MSSYHFLARCYDRLTYDVDYAAWADYIEKHFRKASLPGNTVLDLACGTGSLTRELALRGYEMIGVDQSPEMLSEAAEKNRGAAPIEPIFLCQSMDQLDLYGTIDACVCCLDSVNYVTDPRKLAKAFQRVHLFLMPGGLFLFDINSPEKLEGLDGQVFLDETEDTYCVWRAEFSRHICSYFMDIFQLDGETGQWERGEELHRERAYTVAELTAMLEEAGFREIRTFGELKLRPPRAGEQRIFFTARKDSQP